MILGHLVETSQPYYETYTSNNVILYFDSTSKIGGCQGFFDIV